MMEVVLNVDVVDKESRTKAMEFISSIPGVDSIDIDTKEKNIRVVGDMDPVDLVLKLREEKYQPKLISVGPANTDGLNKAESKDQSPLLQKGHALPEVLSSGVYSEGTSNLEELESDKGVKRVTQMRRQVISTAREIPSQDNFDYSGRVYINGKVIQHDSLKCAEKFAGPIKPEAYWYDAKAGFWGVMGHYCLGMIPPYIQELSSPINCAGGNTTICVNGRELPQRDLDLLVARGLPTINNKKYIIDIQGIVIDEETNEFIIHLGKIAPTVEKRGRGFGMVVPKDLNG